MRHLMSFEMNTYKLYSNLQHIIFIRCIFSGPYPNTLLREKRAYKMTSYTSTNSGGGGTFLQRKLWENRYFKGNIDIF